MNQHFALITISEDALKTLVFGAVKDAIERHYIEHQQPAAPQQPTIKGIHQLAKFLNVSPARAQKLKNSGAFPYFQDGRTLLFDPDQVRNAMKKKEGSR